MTTKTVGQLRQSSDFKNSLFATWDGQNEKQSKSTPFATSNAIINDSQAVLNSSTVKQLFAIQLSKRFGYTYYYYQGLTKLLQDGLTFVHQGHEVELKAVKQYITVTITNTKNEVFTCYLSHKGLAQLKKSSFNKVAYKVVWDLLERYEQRKNG
jgi:hypothetical protein